MTSIKNAGTGTLKLIEDRAANESKNLLSFSSSKNAVLGIFADSSGKDAYLAVNFVEPSSSSAGNKVTLEIKGHKKAEVYIGGEKSIADIVDGVLELQLSAGQGAFVIPV